MKEYVFIHDGGFTSFFGEYQDSPIMENLGTTLEDYREGKYVLLSEEQIDFVRQNEGITPEEAWTMELNDEVSPAEIDRIIAEIEIYDVSDEVNTFYINDTPVWFSKETRVGLNNSVSIEKEVGKETTVLWVNGEPYTMTVDAVKQMLVDLELYAVECYNNTQRNIAEARSLTLRSEIRDFDITKGYPEKLKFNIQ